MLSKMSKQDNYDAGQQDGRNGFARNSTNRDYFHGYNAGKQEYDYWNDKDLYPSLRHEGDDGSSRSHKVSAGADDSRVSGGSVLSVVLVWLMIFAPFALFSTWENWLVQVIFWGGIVIVMLVFAVWLCGAIGEERRSKTPPEEPADDPNLSWYKKCPPADVIPDNKKK